MMEFWVRELMDTNSEVRLRNMRELEREQMIDEAVRHVAAEETPTALALWAGPTGFCVGFGVNENYARSAYHLGRIRSVFRRLVEARD